MLCSINFHIAKCDCKLHYKLCRYAQGSNFTHSNILMRTVQELKYMQDFAELRPKTLILYLL